MKRIFAYVPLVLLANVAAAEPTSAPTPGSTYRVQKGDTCVSITMRAYGDRSKIEVLHKGNPQLGPLPHRLVPGTELMIPFPSGAEAAPDAKLRAVRNSVVVEAAAPKPGKVNDPLFRGNRIATEKRSGADVMFRDESQLRMGEQTLVIILGDTRTRTREVERETTLVSGDLTAKLSSLAKTRIKTEGASADVSGEARVSVDSKKTTRVAALKGNSSITAQNKKVEVKEGFGSKAELGKAPTPPRPLPQPPTWKESLPTMALVVEGTTAKVAADLAEATDAKLSGYRVQIAYDAEFRDLVSDVFVPASVHRIEAEALVPGEYFLRVASVDDDEFVGQFGAPSSVNVVAVREAPEGYVAVDPSVKCTTTAAPGKRTTRCVSAGGGRVGEIVRAVEEEPAPSPEPAPTPPPAAPLEVADRGFEMTLAGGFGFGWNTRGAGGLADLSAGYALPAGPGALVFGAALGFGGYPEANRGGARLNGTTFGRADVSQLSFDLGVPVAYRFGGRRAAFAPMIGVRPELIYQSVSFANPNDSAGALLFGVRGTVGAQVALGSAWGLELQGGYRLSTVKDSGSAPLRGALFSLGLRRFF